MKKLYFLLPIALWIGSYFLWTKPVNWDSIDMENLWWAFTDVGVGLATLASAAWAIDQNFK